MLATLLVAMLPLCAANAWAQEGTAASTPAVAASGSTLPLKPETALIGLKGGGTFGGDVDMVTQFFKPEGKPPFPVVVFSHGRAADAVDRAKLVRPVPTVQVRYWLGKGFAVVAPIRPGYGKTGGADAENSGASFDSSGQCRARPVFGPTADAGKKAVRATLEWLRSQPWADSHKVILVGQSVGGLVTVASGAEHLEGVIGYVNFAGGSGGNPDRSPGRSCGPEQLTSFYAEAGKATTLPNLWIYAENDQYWGPEVPKEWHAAFAAGGSPTRFVHAPPVPDGNGHGLSSHSQSLWAPYLESFLSSLGVITSTAQASPPTAP